MGEQVQRIVIPYSPRPQFQPFHDRTNRWSCIVAHRRAGKTVACVNDLIRAAVRTEKPNARFAYIAPTFVQAKDIAWDYVKRYTAVIPGTAANESELRVDLPNGARLRLYGAENYDRLRGGFFDGVVLDEYGDMEPRAWSEVVRPALSDRQGWAVFIGTPKGRNHFSEIWEQSRSEETWFSLMLKASETGLLPQSELDDAKRAMTPDQFEQEYECSFQAAVVGAYYAREMREVDNSNRITSVPYEPRVPVHTAWDLGMGDSTAIWFVQVVGFEIRIIDYLENSGVGLDWYAARLREKPYGYGEHILPHDAEVKELGTGKSRVEVLRSLGVAPRVLGQQKVEDGINAVRSILPRCYFDTQKTGRGVEALRQYRKEWDDKRKVFHDRPLHDWTSHASDAFRYLALGLPEKAKSKKINYPNLGIA